MSVAATLQVPEQPAAGGLEYLPLGGDGFSAPQSAYAVNVQLASDASGGTSTITINFDPQFLGLVSYVETVVTGASADVPSRRTIGLSTFESMHDAEDAEEGEGTTVVRLWRPPGAMATQVGGFVPNIVGRIPNTNTETHFLTARIYNFNKRAREFTPLYLLLQNLPR